MSCSDRQKPLTVLYCVPRHAAAAYGGVQAKLRDDLASSAGGVHLVPVAADGQPLALEGVDICQCECSFLARFLPKRLPVPSVLTEHQVYWLHFLRAFMVTGNPVSLLRMVKNLVEEFRWMRRFDRIVFFSEHDRKCLAWLMPGRSDACAVIPLGIDIGYFIPLPNAQQDYDACFLGNCSVQANEDAVLFFLSAVLPRVRRIRPDFSFVIIGDGVGKRLAGRARACAAAVTGRVDDVRPWLSRCRMMVNPMRLGSGLRRKVLEAWAMGVPVVSTRTGAEGYDARHRGNVLLADSAEALAEGVCALLEDEALRGQIGRNGRETAVQQHDRVMLARVKEQLYRSMVCR